jgi:hypothetical protein
VAPEEGGGTLKRPSLAALFTSQFRRTTIVTTIMFACTFDTHAHEDIRDTAA